MTDVLPEGADSGPFFDLWAKIGLRLESIDRQLAKAAQVEQQRLDDYPRNVPLVGTGTVPASGNVPVDMGSPQPGRRWDVKLLVSPDAPTGTIQWYVGTMSSGTSVQPVDTAMRWRFATSPAVANFGDNQIQVGPNDHLIAWVSGAATGTVVNLVAVIQDYPAVTASPVTLE